MVLPAEIRKELEITEGDLLEIAVDDAGRIVLEKVALRCVFCRRGRADRRAARVRAAGRLLVMRGEARRRHRRSRSRLAPGPVAMSASPWAGRWFGVAVVAGIGAGLCALVVILLAVVPLHVTPARWSSLLACSRPAQPSRWRSSTSSRTDYFDRSVAFAMTAAHSAALSSSRVQRPFTRWDLVSERVEPVVRPAEEGFVLRHLAIGVAVDPVERDLEGDEEQRPADRVSGGIPARRASTSSLAKNGPWAMTTSMPERSQLATSSPWTRPCSFPRRLELLERSGERPDHVVQVEDGDRAAVSLEPFRERAGDGALPDPIGPVITTSSASPGARAPRRSSVTIRRA